MGLIGGFFRRLPPKAKAVVIVLFLAVMAVAFIFLRFQEDSFRYSESTSPTIDIVKAAGRHLALPWGSPNVSRLQDVDIPKQEQPNFYANAMKGDWVLAYPSMVIVYRIETDQIVAVLPVKQ